MCQLGGRASWRVTGFVRPMGLSCCRRSDTRVVITADCPRVNTQIVVAGHLAHFLYLAFLCFIYERWSLQFCGRGKGLLTDSIASKMRANAT